MAEILGIGAGTYCAAMVKISDKSTHYCRFYWSLKYAKYERDCGKHIDGDHTGIISVGTISVGTISVGTISVGMISVGTISVGTISVGTISVGTIWMFE